VQNRTKKPAVKALLVKPGDPFLMPLTGFFFWTKSQKLISPKIGKTHIKAKTHIKLQKNSSNLLKTSHFEPKYVSIHTSKLKFASMFDRNDKNIQNFITKMQKLK